MFEKPFKTMPTLLILIFLTNFKLGSPEWADSIALFHGSRTEKKIALTFDACPSSTHHGYDSLVVRALIDSCVPATFFLSGRWILRHQQETKFLASVPFFELGNHSYSHPHCTMLSDDSIRLQLNKTEDLLKKFTGRSPRIFRPPFGESDQRTEGIARDLGLRTVMYDLPSGDPDSTISRNRLIRYISSHTQNGSVIVMHVNGRGWKTAQILPDLIALLRKKGFVFVKISEF